MLPYGRQSISEADIESVVTVLRSDYLTQGPAVPRFEQAFSAVCGARRGVAVSSGTAALHVALLAMGVGPGDRVWTSPITFVASANAARYCGAVVDFVDVDPGTINLCPDRLAEKLEVAEREDCLPKVVIPVHFAGQPCRLDEIAALGDRYGFRILEDAAHALGGSYKGEPIGNCRWSDAVIHSFHPVKIITTGEGGMITTNDEELAWRMSTLRSHGITREPGRMVSENDGPWYYQQLELGYHYRMTDIQAALGASQLSRLPEFHARRVELAKIYDEAIAAIPELDQVRAITPLARDGEAESGWHLYVVRLSSMQSEAEVQRCRVFEAMRSAGIGVNVHYIPVHLQPDYTRLGFGSGAFPKAEGYYKECLTLPLFPDMTESDVTWVVETMARIL